MMKQTQNLSHMARFPHLSQQCTACKPYLGFADCKDWLEYSHIGSGHMLQQQSWVIVTVVVWPMKLKRFAIWPLMAKVCWPLSWVRAPVLSSRFLWLHFSVQSPHTPSCQGRRWSHCHKVQTTFWKSQWAIRIHFPKFTVTILGSSMHPRFIHLYLAVFEMAFLIQWTWTWADSGGWWGTGKPVVLNSMGSWRVGHDLVTEQQHLRDLHCVNTAGSGLQEHCSDEHLASGCWQLTREGVTPAWEFRVLGQAAWSQGTPEEGALVCENSGRKQHWGWAQ